MAISPGHLKQDNPGTHHRINQNTHHPLSPISLPLTCLLLINVKIHNVRLVQMHTFHMIQTTSCQVFLPQQIKWLTNQLKLITLPRCSCVCLLFVLSVCLSVCEQDNSKMCLWLSTKHGRPSRSDWSLVLIRTWI